MTYYRKCLPSNSGESPAAILQPLYDLATVKVTGKAFKTLWDEKGLIENFNKSKQLLVQACTLTHLDPTAPLALVTVEGGLRRNAPAAIVQRSLGAPRLLVASLEAEPVCLDNLQAGDVRGATGHTALP